MTFRKISNRSKGIIYIIISAFFFALTNLFVALSGDLPAVQKSFFRNIVAFIFAFIVLIREKDSFNINRKNYKYLLLRSIFGTVGILCNFYAIDHLVLSDASMLNKMSPFFAILFSFLILKEKVTISQGIIIFVSFIGSLFVIKPSFSNIDFLPALIGLLGGVAAGAAYTLVRKLGEFNTKGPFVVFFFSGFSCIVTFPFLIFNYHPMSGMQILYLLLAGLAASGGQFAITSAYFKAPAKEISVYDYSQILFTAVLGLVVFGQIPDYCSVLGYVIIIGMAVLMFFYNKKKNKYIARR